MLAEPLLQSLVVVVATVSLLLLGSDHDMTTTRRIFIGLDVQPYVQTCYAPGQATTVLTLQAFLFQLLHHLFLRERQRQTDELCMLLGEDKGNEER